MRIGCATTKESPFLYLSYDNACALGAAVRGADPKVVSWGTWNGKLFYDLLGITVRELKHRYRFCYAGDLEEDLMQGKCTRLEIASRLEAIGL